MPCLCTKKDLKFQTLASGSKGNCAIVLCDNINLIIDAGILYSPLKKRLEENNLYKIILTGIKNIEINKNEINKLIEKNNIIKIKDKTEIKYNLNKLAEQKNLKGIFVKKILEKENLDEEELKMAIEIGLKIFE